MTLSFNKHPFNEGACVKIQNGEREILFSRVKDDILVEILEWNPMGFGAQSVEFKINQENFEQIFEWFYLTGDSG